MGAAPKVKENMKFDLEVVKGPHAGTKVSFSKGAVTIGRGPENDVVLANDPRISRQHAEIKQRGTDFIIVNLSSKNFVMLNGQSIQSEVLPKGAMIQVGDSELRFEYELPVAEPPPAPVNQGYLAPVPPPVPNSYPQQQSPLMPQMPQTPQPPPFNPATVGGGAAAPYQPRPMGQPQYGMGGPAPQSAPRRVTPGGNSRARFYGIIAVVAVLGWFLFSPSKKKDNKDPNAIRSSVISMQDMAEADKRSQELLTLKKEKYDSVQYRRAHENFVRGFRDFQQGQYARAREAFQVVLNLDPENELAKRYLHLSQIKFDELVKFNMIQGNRYREKRNWRMCQSNYSNVLTMLQNRRDDPTFKEAKQFYEECTLNAEGRF